MSGAAPAPQQPGADETPVGPETAADAAERRTTPVELLWDLVFVFAVTQVTTLFAHRPTWAGFGQSLLALALVWWAWSAFVWAANAQEESSATMRACLLSGTVLIFVTGLALPEAFTRESLLFALTYAAVRGLHLALYVDASRRGNAGRSAITGFAASVAAGMVLLVAGALAGDWVRPVAWVAAVAIDYAGPAWLTRERLRGLQQVAVAHFAERYGAFVIICLGESVVAVGVGISTGNHAGLRPLTAGLALGAVLPVITAVAMWWAYFERTAEAAQARLRTHADPVLAAADAYSYLHLLIVAGIIVFAGGVKVIVHDTTTAPMPTAGRLAYCGGVALYLAGVAAFRLRIGGERSPVLVGAAVVLLALFTLSGGIAAWLTGVLVAVVTAGACVAEWRAGVQAPGAPSSI